MTGQQAAITLNLIPGLGSVRIQRLLEYFGSPEIILHADARTLCQVGGIGSAIAESISSWRTTTNAAKELDIADRAGVRVTTIFDEHYPEALRTIHDPPIVLYSLGEWLPRDGERSIAIVGSRLASHYGRLAAKRFAYELAESGITIVSGLAKGIDTEAHTAALDAKGRTIAVIGSGFNHLYPPENAALSRRIIDAGGAVVSEFPMNLRPGKTTFPMRNRIISAWSKATLVVEAPLRSGSLITARQAVEQGRLVYAVPGPIDRPSSEGCHELIRDGASLVSRPSQILDDLGWDNNTFQPELFNTACATSPPATPPVSEQEQLILDTIARGITCIEPLCANTGLTASELTPILAKLQIKRLIVPLPGGEFHHASF